MKFIALKTDDGRLTGNISFYCLALEVSRQAFYGYLDRRDNPWKYKLLADEMLKIHNEDEYNQCKMSPASIGGGFHTCNQMELNLHLIANSGIAAVCLPLVE